MHDVKELNKGMVSIIIPAHNAENWIERSVRSGLNQTYRNIEVIVIENGSTDKTIEILGTIDDNRLTVLQSEKGVSNARNLGIKKAHGEFLTFLDADDWLSKDAIENVINVVDKNIDLVSARYYGDKPFESYKYKKYENSTEEYILKCLYTPTKRGNCTGNLYRTAIIKDNGIEFDTDLTNAEDSVFLMKILMCNPSVIDIETPIYHVYINPTSATRKMTYKNIESFRNAISCIYKILKNSNEKIKNAGYIFALNQLLIIFVHGDGDIIKKTRLIKKICSTDVFSEAINASDISKVEIGKRIVFCMIKMRMNLLIALIVSFRAAVNSYRGKKKCNG